MPCECSYDGLQKCEDGGASCFPGPWNAPSIGYAGYHGALRALISVAMLRAMVSLAEEPRVVQGSAGHLLSLGREMSCTSGIIPLGPRTCCSVVHLCFPSCSWCHFALAGIMFLKVLLRFTILTGAASGHCLGELSPQESSGHKSCAVDKS